MFELFFIDLNCHAIELVGFEVTVQFKSICSLYSRREYFLDLTKNSGPSLKN